jgi:hypothetical protein
LGVALFIKNSPGYYYCGLIQQTKKWKVKQMYFYILLVLRNTIETCCLFIIGGYTAKRILPISKILALSVIYSIIIMLIRTIPIKFGIHTIIGMTMMIIFYYNFFDLNINQSAIAVFSTFVLLVAIEWLNSYFFLNLLEGLSLKEMGKTINTPEMFITGLPPLLILVLLALVARISLSRKLKSINESIPNKSE